MSLKEHKGWIAVDLDGTLANYTHWINNDHIGEPVPRMLARVKKWLKQGKDVRIFTARVSAMSVRLNKSDPDSVRVPIEKWCLKHLGAVLPITCEKDLAMIELWDDRCKQVEFNTGICLDGSND